MQMRKNQKLPVGRDYYSPVPIYKHHFYQLAYSYRHPSYDLIIYSIVKDNFFLKKADTLWKQIEALKSELKKEKEKKTKAGTKE